MKKRDISTYPTIEQVGRKKVEIDDLKGNTLKVYYYLADTAEPSGPREIQRQLGLSSPSLAVYHLNRLLEANLVQKTADGRYFIEGDPVRLGELKDHVKIAGNLIPRILLYIYHALLSIFVAVIFYINDLPIVYWFAYTIGSSLIFSGLLLYDAKKLYGHLIQKKLGKKDES